MLYKEKLKVIRTDKKITQNEIASFVGIHRGRYSQYEIEADIMPIKHLNSVCNYFDISLDYLFDFTNSVNYKDSSKDIDSKKVGERLKEFRKEQKITQAMLAKDLNTTQSVIANYERGRNIIATPFLYDICKKYKVSADYLLGKIDEPKYLK